MDFEYDHMCFGCGKKNPLGLHLEFKKDGEKVHTVFIPEEEHQGYPGVMHGGLISTIMDEVMARSINVLGYHGVTARLEIRFREAVPIGQAIAFESVITNTRKSIVDLEAKAILLNGTVAAEATARFMILGKIEGWEKESLL